MVDFCSQENYWYYRATVFIWIILGKAVNLYAIFLLILIYCAFTNRSQILRNCISCQKEITESKNRFRALSEILNTGIIIMSETTSIEYFSNRTLELLSTTSENLASTIQTVEYCHNKKLSNFTSSNFLIADINYLLQNRISEEISLGIALIGSLSLECRARCILWENKHSLFLSLVNANEIIELENKIANDKMKTLFLRSVSHELRTPLNSIICFTNELLDSPTLVCSEEEHTKLGIIAVSSKLMLSMINNLLDYSKILSGALSVQKSYCDIREIIKNTHELLEIQAKKKGLDIICRIDPNLPTEIYTDPLRLSQIFLNLLSNALKFTYKGAIEICCVTTAKMMMKCYIEDSGVGIDNDIIQKIFTNFGSQHFPTIKKQGSGLGLYISNLLVKQLGGKRIKVNSVPNKGSTFQFSIEIFESNPISEVCEVLRNGEKDDSRPEIVISNQNYSKPLNSQEILIVDDMEFNLEILGSIFKKYGAGYEEASNGKIAIEKVLAWDTKDQPFKVIIMDCDMPEMNGWEASRAIDQMFREGKLRNMPRIIGYTAYNSDEDVKLCFESGMVGYLPKPSPPEKIINSVRGYL
ncbi:unnamed protein product [Blepharisma stoltei]|uniref:Histidine kinase n=1 Tax=Blepharisma stoltei TaxID=1481888 RepID=A0AAU9IHL0_9CILI|nr:unnamed protein product [Blepharisma stoltei]